MKSVRQNKYTKLETTNKNKQKQRHSKTQIFFFFYSLKYLFFSYFFEKNKTHITFKQ